MVKKMGNAKDSELNQMQLRVPASEGESMEGICAIALCGICAKCALVSIYLFRCLHSCMAIYFLMYQFIACWHVCVLKAVLFPLHISRSPL